VIEELCRIAFVDIRNVCQWDANGVTPHDSTTLSEVVAATIKKVTHRRTTRLDKQGNEIVEETTSIELHDKLAALDKLMRHMGIDGVTKVAQSGHLNINSTVNLADLFADALADEEQSGRYASTN
jgi:Terminase small subunit